MPPLSACTIVSKNYLAFARVLADSFLEHHPDGRFFVLIVDRIEGEFDPAAEPFTVVLVEDLPNIENLPSFLFKYTQLECNTAVKPFFMEHLMERYELDHLLYLDPDILVLSRFDGIEEVIEESAILLVPHLTEPIDDLSRPGECDILIAGAYNLGFLGLTRGDTTARFLEWWKKRLYDLCIVAIERGLFVDQRWIDLVPGMFDGVRILKDPGYDVAYWNLHGRRLSFDDGPRANGQPLYFFHFSGIDIDRLEFVSKHQTRFVLSQLGGARALFEDYRDRLLAAGHRRCIEWPYAFGVYADGAPISDEARKVYRELGPSRDAFGDPFDVEGSHSFRSWLTLDGRGADGAAPMVPLRRAGLRGGVHAAVRRLYGTGLVRFFRRALRRLLGPDLTFRLWSWTDGVSGRALSAGATVAPAAEPAGDATLSHDANGSLIARRIGASPGVNIVGYLRAETGMGEAGRGLARAVQTTPTPLALQSIDLNVVARCEDRSVEHLDGSHPHGINLFCVNADQVPSVVEYLGPERFLGHYNIGYWLWESSVFPEEWLPAFGPFQEIWTPSAFCADVFSAVSPVPVRRVPLPIGEPPDRRHGRAHFELPEETFLFVFAFDFLSVWERKNPLATIRAFREAFGPGDDVRLVLKTSRSDWDEKGADLIRREIGDLPVTWIDRYLSRQEVSDLFRACDCYVSLHRSEGYGLTIAEAMALEKPVIATAYSGNVDFFDVNNGWPVAYELAPLKEAVGPYPAGSLWAEPDVSHAAEQMRRVYEDERERRSRAARARRDVVQRLGERAVGRLVDDYLRQIRERVGRSGEGIEAHP